MKRNEMGDVFESLYTQLNRREMIHPDPLECVYGYTNPADREVAALIAACLAYGRVAHILANVRRVLHPMGPSPRAFLLHANRELLTSHFQAFQHRWTTSAELIGFLMGIHEVLSRYGTLEECFRQFHRPDTGHSLAGLTGLVLALGGPNSLLSLPEKGSACKRLHLFLRWMARNDDVDPGCWTAIAPAHLIIPLDTHMHRVSKSLRLTRRKQPNLAAALDITRAFNQIRPDDPLRYDFTLTRFGIRNEMNLPDFLRQCHNGGLINHGL